MLSYRFRLYPSKRIQETLNDHIELCRWLYNKLLAEVNTARQQGREVGKNTTQALIVTLKQAEKPELRTVYSKALQMVNYQLWSALRGLSALKHQGKKVGRLRYKGQGRFRALTYNQSGFTVDLERHILRLSKVGELPIRVHRPLHGEIKGVIIKREPSGKWYALFQVEDEEGDRPPKGVPHSRTGKTVGIDVGITHFLTDTEGRQVENPNYYERTLERIRLLHRDVSRKKKGSKNREKSRIKLVSAYEKLVNQRNDFLHKLSRFYVTQYDVICVEDLRIRNMVRNHYIARKILDAAWGTFLQLVSYKAESAGKTLVKVNPRDTSQDGDKTLDRDYRAAWNIHNRGLSSLGTDTDILGLGQPLEPVERRPLRRIPAHAVITGHVSSMKQEAPCDSGGSSLAG
jgi:putative transposase